jgi:GNAT superfamily N-acetyltransferase
MNKLRIARARETDTPLILSLIKELAEVEKFPFDLTVTETDLKTSLFGEQPAAEVIIGYLDEEPVGFAVYYQTFATTTGRSGLHLDDLYVRPQFQGNGFGKRILGHLARLARNRGCARFEWWALEWNEKAIRFYKSIGARNMRELRIFRLGPENIQSVSEKLDR